MIARVKQYILSGYSLLLKLLPTKRMQIFALILFFAITTSGVLIATLPAAAFGVSTVVNGIITGIVYLLLLLATLFIQITIFFLKFFILIAGYNNYINAPVVLLGWNMIRDVANMFFVVILLVIAFSTILGLEQYEWRKALVKLILAAILVNFSNLILQLIIDVAQVFMITFLNAVAGAAGGNLINMFNLDKILNLSVGNNPEGDKIQLELMAAGVMALVFAAVAMFTMFAYIVVLLYRVVLLWVSIILSPLAFLFSVLPQTKSYADEFWKEFTNHVIAGPMMVFFLWLAFATFGGGGITQHLEQGNPIPSAKISTANSVEDISGKKPGASINEAASWENMANFIVAIAFLWIGIERVQKLGVRGGGLTAGAIDFGKKVATIASGYAVGRWLVGKGADAGKAAAYYAPAIGGEKWEKRGKIIASAAKGWYYGKGTNMSPEGERMRDELKAKYDARKYATPQGKAELAAEIAAMEDRKRDVEASNDSPEKTKELETLTAGIDGAKKLQATASLKSQDEWDKEIESDEKQLQKELRGGFIGKMARSGAQLDKQVDKTVGQADYRYKLLRKRTGSESGGIILGGLIQFGMGAGKAKFMGIPLGKYFSDPYALTGESQDRIERGWYQAEEARSAAKDAELETKGRLQGLKSPRLKYNVEDGKVKFEFAGGSVADRIAMHKAKGEGYESDIHLLEQHAHGKIIHAAEKQIAAIDNSKAVKGVKEAMVGFEKEGAKLRESMNLLQRAQAAQAHIDRFASFDNDKFKEELLAKEENSVEKLLADNPGLSKEQEADLLAAHFKKIEQLAQAEFEKLQNAKKTAEENLEKIKSDSRGSGGTKQEQDKREADFIAILQNIPESIEKTKEAIKVADKEKVTKQKDYSKAFLDEIEKLDKGVGGEDGKGQLAVGWKIARNKALAEHHDLFHHGEEKSLQDTAAQRHIWDAKGINTPNNAQLAIFESLLKDFAAMDYNASLAAVTDNMAVISEKIKQGKEISFEDGAIIQVLLKKLHSGSWIDDAIIPTEALQKLGVKVSEELKDKINQQLGRDLELIRSNYRGSGMVSSGGRGSGGGVSSNIDEIKAMAAILKNALGDGAKEFIIGLRNGNANVQEKLSRALLANIGEGVVNIDRNFMRQANLDPSKAGRDIAKEIAQFIAANHSEISKNVQ